MTPKSKSALAVPEPHERREEYLTTVGSQCLNPEAVLAVAGTRPVTLVAVAIVPKGTHTGLLEERGDWIHRLWAAALDSMPLVQGCRMSWDSVFFMAETSDLIAVQEQFRRLLSSLRVSGLQSRCILSRAAGSPEDKGRLLYNEMSHDLTAVGLGFRSRFTHKMIDGSDWTD
jgi:hypothetical protein